ncbi:TPA: hypothetical protein ACKRQV_006650 [Pseudomonas aeruginosa]|nr:hypothetical protein [Pseudomonas aeruginosa]EIU2864232.1 hypothetical protein [Pseudomonas aeruginosa]
MYYVLYIIAMFIGSFQTEPVFATCVVIGIALSAAALYFLTLLLLKRK